MRTRLTLVVLGAVVAALATAAYASSSPRNSAKTAGASATHTASTTTLRMAFSYDPGSLDPDVFYDGEGATITEAAYEGLVQYSDNSTPQIVPLLAKSWTISKNGLTYTFLLRSGVKFQDGTTMTSKTWKAEIQRRLAMNQGSAYMVRGIGKIGTPTPTKLVLTLKKPMSAFLDYLASTYGPKAVSPTAVAMHTKKGDHGTGWLANNSAGTGPYQLVNVNPGQSWELKAFPGYWGPKPQFTTVQFTLVPSFTTQALELQNGQLDLVYHGISWRDLKRFEGGKFQVKQFPDVVRLTLWINPNVKPFTDPAVRLAVAHAIQRQPIISQVYGSTATTAKQIFPSGALPLGMGMYTPQYNPSILKALVPKLSSKKVDLAYTTDDSLNAQVAQLVQTQLSAAGLSVTTRGVTQQTTWSWPTKPAGRSSMLILPANPDDADPSSYASLFYAKAGGLSYFSPSNVAKADALLNKGLYSKNRKEATPWFAKAAAAYTATGNYIPLADQKLVVAARADLCNWHHDFATLWALRVQGLKTCG